MASPRLALSFLGENCDKFLPMILRFCSGSVTPDELVQKRSEASTPITRNRDGRSISKVPKLVFRHACSRRYLMRGSSMAR
jgi:hypothetical protein